MDWRCQALGAEECPPDLKSLKKLYARALRRLEARQDPEALQNLHEAYEDLRDELRDESRAQVPPQNTSQHLSFECREEDAPPLNEALVEEPDLHSDPARGELQDREENGERSDGSEGRFQEPDEVGGMVTDWDAIDEWLDAFDSGTGTLLERLHHLLDHPLMADPNAAAAAEQHIVVFLEEALENSESEERFDSFEIDAKVVSLIEQRFKWLSDFTSFNRSYPHSTEVVYAMGRVIDENVQEETVADWSWKNLLELGYKGYLLILGLCVLGFLFNLLGAWAFPEVSRIFVKIVGWILTYCIIYFIASYLPRKPK